VCYPELEEAAAAGVTVRSIMADPGEAVAARRRLEDRVLRPGDVGLDDIEVLALLCGEAPNREEVAKYVCRDFWWPRDPEGARESLDRWIESRCPFDWWPRACDILDAAVRIAESEWVEPRPFDVADGSHI